MGYGPRHAGEAMKSRPDRDGFSLAEALVSMVIAAVALALLFQLSAGSARLRGASDEAARVAEIANTRLQEARLTLTGPARLSGETQGVAWRIDAVELAQRADGSLLLSVEAYAQSETGRSAVLTSAVAIDPPEDQP